jgi:hypothetical protein
MPRLNLCAESKSCTPSGLQQAKSDVTLPLIPPVSGQASHASQYPNIERSSGREGERDSRWLNKPTKESPVIYRPCRATLQIIGSPPPLGAASHKRNDSGPRRAAHPFGRQNFREHLQE